MPGSHPQRFCFNWSRVQPGVVGKTKSSPGDSNGQPGLRPTALTANSLKKKPCFNIRCSRSNEGKLSLNHKPKWTLEKSSQWPTDPQAMLWAVTCLIQRTGAYHHCAIIFNNPPLTAFFIKEFLKAHAYMKTWFKAEMGKSNIKGKNMNSKCC